MVIKNLCMTSLCFFVLLLSACNSSKSDSDLIVQIKRPKLDKVKLESFAKLPKRISECSGLAASTKIDGLFWAHNDSGSGSRIYPVYTGKKKNIVFADSVSLDGAKNRDWEDMTSDSNGHIIIGDVGNNRSKDLVFTLYYFDEPDSFTEKQTTDIKKYRFEYADFDSGPGNRNFDCEAIFSFKGRIYLLTKNHSDKNTCLYRFNKLNEKKTIHPDKISGFTSHGRVTAAEMSAQQKRLAVLTYNNIWVFSDFDADSFFNGSVYYLPISAKQCEAVSFISEEELLICNEQRDMFRLHIDKMIKLR